MIIKQSGNHTIEKHCVRLKNNSMYSPQGFVKQLSNGKWGYELTLSWMMYNDIDGYAVRTSTSNNFWLSLKKGSQE